MSTFNVSIPDRGPTRKVIAAVDEARFGDGYAQRVASGLNSVREAWTLSFTLRTKTEIKSIEDFLSGLLGVSNFDWVTPRGDTLKFVCKEWSSSYEHDGDCSLTCVFEQDFGV